MKPLRRTRAKKPHPHLNSAGLGLLETLFIIVVASVAMLAAAQISMQLLKGKARIADLYTLQSLTRSMAVLLADDVLWRNATMPGNTSMGCLPSGCGVSFKQNQFAVYDSYGKLISGVERPVIVYSAPGTALYDSKVPKTGFTLNGQACSNFPSLDCPATIKVNWYPISTKSYPIIAFTIRLIVDPEFTGANVGTAAMSFDAGPDQDQLKPPVIYRGTM